ncbi:cupin-like domain-containing protein [Sphingomonas sp. A2-49]|uniref:cupin-like domain-containing protein n=1 Tax=Sphingomonas sp. A2-49 TaxID=1391375 RepID=UPI0021D3BC20|nr:cupin-like domain-containing protein [Sphingomonas sp. A2-49]MCU6455729.1 cupin-like domain-containing protein [Sphingomonas sp. A2-49]
MTGRAAPITSARVAEIDAAQAGPIDPQQLVRAGEPVIVRGYARDWPLVAAGRDGPQAAADYLLSFYGGRPGVGYTARADAGGRYFYDESLTRLDFEGERVQLDAYIGRMLAHLGDAGAPAFYVGSTDLDQYFPGLAAAGNDLALGGPAFAQCLRSIWIGNRTIASAHHDMSNNIACVAVGERRFTLFPPEQVANLYPGPLEPTPGGQVVSLVDFRDPDLARFPRFADARAAARVAELGPGDAVIYPALWWHHVEALADFNVMINFWWNEAPAFMDSPMNTLLHGLLSLRDRPEPEKRAWAALFDYYVFGPADRPVAHLPEAARGILAPLDTLSARQLRARLLQRINR